MCVGVCDFIFFNIRSFFFFPPFIAHLDHTEFVKADFLRLGVLQVTDIHLLLNKVIFRQGQTCFPKTSEMKVSACMTAMLIYNYQAEPSSETETYTQTCIFI